MKTIYKSAKWCSENNACNKYKVYYNGSEVASILKLGAKNYRVSYYDHRHDIVTENESLQVETND